MDNLTKNFVKILLALILHGHVSAQQGMVPVSFPLLYEDFSLTGKAAYLLTSKNMKASKTIMSYPFIVINNIGGKNHRPLPDSTELIWIRFRIYNKLPNDTAVVLKAQLHNYRMILYEQVNGDLQEIGRSGNGMPISQLSIKDDNKRIRIPLKARQVQTFLLQDQRLLNTWPGIPVLQSEDRAALEQLRVEKAIASPRRQYFLIFAGFHLAIFFISFIKYYFQNKDKAYLYYSLCSVFIFAIYLIQIGVINLESAYWNNITNKPDISFLFNVTGVIFYVAFQNELLQLSTKRPALFMCIKIYLGIVLAGVALSLLFNQLQIYPYVYRNSLIFFQLGQILWTVVIVYITRKQTGFYKYVFCGLISLLIGCCIFLFILWSGLQMYFPSWFGIDTHIALPAIAIEVLFFLMALVYRDKQLEVVKIETQQQLLKQLEKNKMLQDSFTRNLEEQLKEKTAQLIEQRLILEKEREAKLHAEFEQKLSESELKALRSQINPHFIFNCLNSIKLYATQNDINAASDYLTKFSKLLRKVLDNSKCKAVALSDELEVLQLYIEMEAMRFKDKLKYAITVEDVDVDYIEVPPMLLQPYVENAIWHGLMNKEGGGHLEITAVMKDDANVIITIKDDGIGRVKAAELKSKMTVQHKSSGMQITSERLALINQIYKKAASVAIEDLTDEEGRAAGTQVTIQIEIS